MSRPWRLAGAVECLAAGGVVAYPTEGVFGLGCDPLCAEAAGRILAIKGRPARKGLILVAADFEQIEPYLGLPEPPARVRATWPGPVTWILPVHPTVPAWLTGATGRVAVRVTAHPGAAALCRAYGGALVSTSANRAGAPPARTALEVRCRLGALVDRVVVGAVDRQAGPTEIRDGVTGAVVRPGAGAAAR